MGKRERRRGVAAGGARTRQFVRLLPALMIAAGVVFDLNTPPEVSAIPLFAAAPLIAAPFFSLASTIRTAVAAILTVLAIRLYDDTISDVAPVTELFTLVTVSVLALVINGVVRRSNEQLASARVIAETAMRAVLPTPDDRIGGLLVAARYEAAQADEFVGGDLFAVADTPHGVRLVVGDVRGKGLAAVEAVAVVIGAFREAAEQELSLEGVAQRLERALAREGTRRGGLDSMEGFVTAVLAEIPAGSGRLRIVNRGHPEPILLHADGAARGAGADRAGAADRDGPGGVAGPVGRVGTACRGDAPGVHGRPLRGAGRGRGLLRPGGPAARPDLPGARGTALGAHRRRTAAHEGPCRGRHGAARGRPACPGAAGAADDCEDRGAGRWMSGCHGV